MSPPATPSGHASVSASLTQVVLHAAVALGLPRAALLQDSGLAEADLNAPDARIPFTRQEALWHSIARHLDTPEPGLALGRALAPGQFSVLGYLLQSSPTLGEALEAELRYQRLVGGIGARFSSSLTRRIVVLNLGGLVALFVSFLYLNQFREGLIDARVQSLQTQGETPGGRAWCRQLSRPVVDRRNAMILRPVRRPARPSGPGSATPS